MRNVPLFYRRFLRLLPGCWLAGLLLGSIGGAVAQTAPDTTHLRYGEEVSTELLPIAPLPVQREARQVWKLGLNNFLFDGQSTNQLASYYSRFGLHLAYERQLGSPAWSVLGEVSPAIASYRSNASAGLERALSVRAQLAGRYYYNLERRLLRGRRTGSFSANYVGVALGAGLGRRTHETPFYRFPDNHGRLVTPDVALLYGLQRRLGRRWFIDANVGLAGLLVEGSGYPVTLSSSLRVGLLLDSPPPAPARPVPANADESLRPRLYVGVRSGVYSYRVAYSNQYPYPPNRDQPTTLGVERVHYGKYYNAIDKPSEGYGTYTDYVVTSTIPCYFYGGYYLTPRLAVQLGVQWQRDRRVNYTSFETPTDIIQVGNGLFEGRDLALPILLRYGLTPAFLRRWQFDVVGGLVPVWSSAEFREQQIVNYEVTAQPTFGFRRNVFGLHGSLGLDAAYGFGRRRRVQATFEVVANKDLRTFFEDKDSWQGGVSLGLRYRFGYR